MYETVSFGGGVGCGHLLRLVELFASSGTRARPNATEPGLGSPTIRGLLLGLGLVAVSGVGEGVDAARVSPKDAFRPELD